MFRTSTILTSIAMSCALGCTTRAGSETTPGRETGACVEDECLGDLMCLSEVCVDPNATPGNSGGTGGETDAGGGQLDPTSVSVLVVIDNSGSMATEQAQIAPALGQLAVELTQAGIDWRMGITTSDNGNPWCSGTSTEGGRFRLSSCRSRQSDFVFDGAIPVDATQEACLDVCEYDAIDVLSTEVVGQTSVRARPWIESIGGASNLAAGVPLEAALACLAPQGVNGCGFEQQLESAYKAIQLTETDRDAQFGFLSNDALLVVVLVTDEADCSYNEDYVSIFLPEGDRVFWSLPDEGSPTSAVCWNAGVRCNGGSCESASLDVLGNPVPDAQAVMRPVSRYAAQLASRGPAMVMLIAGTGADGSVTYEPALDPGFADDFGIGPGCASVAGEAVPPVRQRELAELFPLDGGQSMFSICASDYAPAMSALSSAIVGRL